MSTEQILTNAQIVMADEIINGTIIIQEGIIASIDTGKSQLPQAQDLNGHFVLPGLVELHTDNLEKYMAPRPGVDWPSRSAIVSHDGQMACSGITTVFDALSVGDISPHGNRLMNLKPMVKAITEANQNKLTRVDHHLHLRCEVAHPQTLELFLELAENPFLGLVSIMDHSPGQRQFSQIEKYRHYYKGKYGLNDEQMDEFSAQQITNSEKYSQKNRYAITEYCRSRQLPLASHDDATSDHVEESYTLGMKIAEFPTTKQAASYSHQKGMKVLMGAPNIIRGRSHSGNIAAAELAQLDVLDILSSDYYPNSLLHAAIMLTDEKIGLTLPKAISTVCQTPAQAAGLFDRGELKIGLRADIIESKFIDQEPIIQRVWKEGKRVF